MELKQTKVYVPTDVKIELPKNIKAVFTIEKRGNPILNDRIGTALFKPPNIFNSDDEEANYPTHWLKPSEGYFLTKEELERVIRDAFDAARIKCVTNDYGTQGFENKEQYIKQTLK
jgi:hypothetical protein